MPRVSTKGDPERQVEEWGLERDRYLALLHIYNLAGAAGVGSLTSDKVMRDLAFPEERADLIVRNLIAGGLVQQSVVGGGLTLSSLGTRYIEREAGRRRSVRLLR